MDASKTDKDSNVVKRERRGDLGDDNDNKKEQNNISMDTTTSGNKMQKMNDAEQGKSLKNMLLTYKNIMVITMLGWADD